MQTRQAPLLSLIPALSAVVVLAVAPTAAADGCRAPERKHSVDVTLGGALTAPNHRSDVSGTGPYVGATFTALLEPFVSLHAYSALMFTLPQSDDREQCETVDCNVTTQVLLLGGKGRLIAPVAWVAPFAEAGVGLSFGAVTTRTSIETVELGPAAATLHVPISVGLALGSMHETEVAVTAIFHPEAKQYAVILGVTLSVPLTASDKSRHKRKPWWKFF